MIQTDLLSPTDLDQQNYRQLRRLVMSIQASQRRLNLLVAICDNASYRDELIRTYEAELAQKGIRCYQARLEPQTPSLKQSLRDLVAEYPPLATGSEPALATVLGADELLKIRLNQPKSAQEQFFFSVQWTRESLREFQFPVVLWVTPAIAQALAEQAPDFWSWRGGVFEFSRPLPPVVPEPQRFYQRFKELEPEETRVATTNPEDIMAQIASLTAQDPNSPLLASLYQSLGDAYRTAIRYSEAETAYQKSLELHQHLLGPHHPAVAAILHSMGRVIAAQGNTDKAIDALQRAVALAETSDDPQLLSISLNALGGVLQQCQRWDEAIEVLQRAVAVAETSDDPQLLSISLNALGGVLQQRQRWDEAIDALQRAVTVAETLDNPQSLSISLTALGQALSKHGRINEAVDHLKQGFEIDAANRNSRGLSLIMLHLSQLLTRQGQMDEAIQYAQRALEVAPNHQGLQSLYRQLTGTDEASRGFPVKQGIVKLIRQNAEGIRYGYITPADGSGDIYFREGFINSNIIDLLDSGTLVEVEVKEQNKGPCAAKIRILPDIGEL